MNSRRLLIACFVTFVAVFTGTYCTAWARDALSTPKLGFRMHFNDPLIVMTFPCGGDSVGEDTTFEAWCYESRITMEGTPKIDENGVMVFLHRSNDNPKLLIETTVTPSPGSVSFVAKANIVSCKNSNSNAPIELPYLNICFQEGEAAGFKSRPDSYPDFVKRHFIFTKSGRTFLMNTQRSKVPGKPDDHIHNNPPWVQLYTPAWQEPSTGKGDWAGYSSAQYVVPIIGTVSRDGTHLFALANNGHSAQGDGVCNAWHDCLHANPLWWPGDAEEIEDKRWQINVYFMENDSVALRKCVEDDFPGLSKLK